MINKKKKNKRFVFTDNNFDKILGTIKIVTFFSFKENPQIATSFLKISKNQGIITFLFGDIHEMFLQTNKENFWNCISVKIKVKYRKHSIQYQVWT